MGAESIGFFVHGSRGWTLGEVDDGWVYTGVGRDIRSVREAAGLQIRDVAQALRISGAFIEAIEAGRYGELPSPVYVNGFVRSYAGYLQLDCDEMVRRVQLELAPAIITEPLQFPNAPQDQPRPSRTLLLLGLALALAVFGFWYLNVQFMQARQPDATAPRQEGDLAVSGNEAPPASEISAAPVETAPAPLPESEPIAEAPQIPPLEELVSENPAAGEAGSKTMDSPVVNEAAPQEAEAMLAEDVGPVEITSTATLPSIDLRAAQSDGAPPAPVPQVAEPAPSVLPEALAKAPVVLLASSDTWMQVSRANGEVLKSWVMRAGEQYVPPQDEAGLKVMVGNAGALTVYVDGAALRELGRKGEVIRALPLDGAALKAKFGG